MDIEISELSYSLIDIVLFIYLYFIVSNNIFDHFHSTQYNDNEKEVINEFDLISM